MSQFAHGTHITIGGLEAKICQVRYLKPMWVLRGAIKVKQSNIYALQCWDLSGKAIGQYDNALDLKPEEDKCS